MTKLMKLHEELDKSIKNLVVNAEHRKLRIDENDLLDLIGKIDCISNDLYLLRGFNLNNRIGRN